MQLASRTLFNKYPSGSTDKVSRIGYIRHPITLESAVALLLTSWPARRSRVILYIVTTFLATDATLRFSTSKTSITRSGSIATLSINEYSAT